MPQRKILIVDTYYPEFVQNMYRKDVALEGQPYAAQLNALLNACFGTSYYYSRHLRPHGWDVQDVIADVRVLQYQWAKEHNVRVLRVPELPIVGGLVQRSQFYKILRAQVHAFQPDVLYMQNLSFCDPLTIRSIKKYCRLLVGQIACPMLPTPFLKPFDLILTSFPHFVPRFHAMGIESEYFKIGFEDSVLERLHNVEEKKYDVVFIGGFTNVHGSATHALEQLAQQVRVDVWGYGIESLTPDSPLRQQYHGEAWGLDMYRIIRQAKICINRHSAASEEYANNMRLYETTGIGTFLLTDNKKNIRELFDIEKEIGVYQNERELIEKTQYYLSHDTERESIAAAGQARTLAEHTYQHRMKELDEILTRYLPMRV